MNEDKVIIRNCALTTFDNPFDPFEQFDSWYLFDMENGYDCCGRLARIMKIEPDFTQKEEEEAKEKAIDEIIKYDFLNIFKKVIKEVEVIF